MSPHTNRTSLFPVVIKTHSLWWFMDADLVNLSWEGEVSGAVQCCKIVSHHRTGGGAFERDSAVQLSVVTLAVNTLSKPSTNFTLKFGPNYLVLSCFLLCFYKQNILYIPSQQYMYWGEPSPAQQARAGSDVCWRVGGRTEHCKELRITMEFVFDIISVVPSPSSSASSSPA